MMTRRAKCRLPPDGGKRLSARFVASVIHHFRIASMNEAKAALINLSKSLSKTYVQEGILVNAVSPALIKTAAAAAVLEQQAVAQGVTVQEIEKLFLQQQRPHIELGPPGRPEEVAAAVVFLASEQASFINGGNLRVDGGSVASI